MLLPSTYCVIVMSDTLMLYKECLPCILRLRVFDTRIANRVWCHDSHLDVKNHIISWQHLTNFSFILGYIFTLISSFYTVNWPCFDANDCAVWMVSWNHVTIAIFILLSSSLCRHQKLLNCIGIAGKLICQQKCFNKQIKSRANIFDFYILLILLLGFKTAILIHLQKSYIVYIFYSISYVVPLSMECLFMILCSVVEDTCYQLKKNLEILSVKTRVAVLLPSKLTEMIHTHQTAANLLRKINICFDKDLAVDLVFNMMWLIIYIYVTTVALWKEPENGLKNADLVIESVFLLTRLTFLSYSVNRIEFEMNNLLTEIRNFHSLPLNPACIQLTNEFLQQVLGNEMKIKVCGLFYINMSFMRGIISLSTTYLIVFIQYGQASQPSKITNTKNVTKK